MAKTAKAAPKEEKWIFGYPPWWAKWLVKEQKGRTLDQARRLLEFMQAIESGNAAKVKKLLKQGLDPNARLLRSHGTPLRCAVERSGSAEVVNVLVKAGAQVRNVDLLLAAGGLRMAKCIGTLVKAGANPNVTYKYDLSPLGHACVGGNAPVAQALIEAGADVNLSHHAHVTASKRVNKVTPLMLAAWQAHLKIVKMLLSAGADPHRKDATGRTALDWAKIKHSKQTKEVAALLAKHGAASTPAGPMDLASPPDWSDAARSASFKKIVEMLKKLTRAKPEPILTEDGPAEGTAVFAMSRADSEKLVQQHHAKVLRQGCYLFFSRDLTEEGGSCVAVVPTTNPYDAIATVGTAGPNEDVGTIELIEWLKLIQRKQPMDIHGIGRDFLSAKFTTPIAQPLKLVKDIVTICCEADNGPSGLKAQAKRIAETRELFLWWD